MKRKYYEFVKVVLFLLLTSTNIFASDNIWMTFNKNPNEINYRVCREQIQTSNDILKDNTKIWDTPVAVSLVSNNKLYNDFLNLVDRRNPYAVELAIQIYPFTDAAAREYLCQAVGKTIKTNPTFLLHLLRKYEVDNDREIRCFIGSYPVDEFTDDVDKNISETKNRIKFLKTVTSPELIEYREKCVSILSNYKRRLEKLKKNMNN
jgi:hypothetical protein